MANSVISKIKRAWNAFRDIDPETVFKDDYQNGVSYSSVSYSSRPDRPRLTRGNERSIVNAVYNRIAVDVAALTINHVRLDKNDRFESIINDGLNKCFNLSANIDQTGREFIQDAVISMLDEGCVALVPTDTDVNPSDTSSYEILSMRTGRVTAWYPSKVRIDVYNERTGHRQEITLPKKDVAIIENPMYTVMNEPNSTLRRLIRKLNLLDYIDEQVASGKFNLIIQLPYTVRSIKKQEESRTRVKDLQKQLSSDNKYGIGYIDSAEKVIQLNRPLENNLPAQIESLTQQLYGQLGITQAIMNGTADEKESLNYTNRAIEPIVSAIVNECKRKFLSKTALTQGQSIMFFRDPFKLVPVDNIAEIADKFTRNEIMTKNEFRQVIGMKPSDDPRADQLRNANLSESSAEIEQRLGTNALSADQDTTNAENFVNTMANRSF